MFIKKVIKTDKKTNKQYVSYRLCESYRLKDSVRHRNLINLGDLKELPTPEKRNTSMKGRRPVIVMDAGLVSEDNLKALKEQGYDYVCVSSADMKKYKEMASQGGEIKIKDSRDNPIYLKLIKDGDSKDNYLYVRSDNKRAKEEAMHRQQMESFEEGLKSIE